MKLDVLSIYSKGFQKTGPIRVNASSIDKNVKEQALALLRDKFTVAEVSEKLNLKYHTVAGWRVAEFKERY